MKRTPQKNDTRTTTLVAIATFIGLSLVSLVAWSLTRTEAPAPPVAAASVVAPVEDHSHAETFERITAEELKAALDRNEVTVIDVRSVEQFAGLHIAGSLHIPVARIEGEIPYLPKGKTVVTYCTCPAEESSGEAAMILAHGGMQAKALQGGLDSWTKLGYPTAAGVQ